MKELSRRERILKLIVEQFIKSAIPVGSNTLLDEFHLPYSSATIRNEMVELEDQGMIEKPHTSAGRVPSAKGYRYYIDHLREKELDQGFKYQLETLFEDRQIAIEEVIRQGCEIITQMTNLTSVILGPSSSFERMNKIQLIPLNPTTVVAVFITDQGHVEHKTFNIPTEVNLSDVETCVDIMNDRLCGTRLVELTDKVESIRPLIAERVKHHERLFRAFLEAFMHFASERVSIVGRENMMEQPEFTNDIHKLKKLVSLLENDSAWRLLETKEGISVRIGNENTLTDLGEVSVVTAQLGLPESEMGTIALIGPTRMDYEKIINALEFFKDRLKEFVEKEGNTHGEK